MASSNHGVENRFGNWFGEVLAQQYGSHPDPLQVADVAIDIWHDIAAALQSIIGKQGFAALYDRSAAVAAQLHPWLAGSRAGEDHAVDFAALRALIVQQSSENAVQGSRDLLQTFYAILAGLIGPVLSEQLLWSVRHTLRSRGSRAVNS